MIINLNSSVENNALFFRPQGQPINSQQAKVQRLLTVNKALLMLQREGVNILNRLCSVYHKLKLYI